MANYKYRVTGPRGGKYLTSTRKEAEKLTRHGGSFRALGQKKASKVKNPKMVVDWKRLTKVIGYAHPKGSWTVAKVKAAFKEYHATVTDAEARALVKRYNAGASKVKNPARDGMYSSMNPKIEVWIEGSSRVTTTQWYSTVKAAKAAAKRAHPGKKVEAWIADSSERGSGGRRRNPRAPIGVWVKHDYSDGSGSWYTMAFRGPPTASGVYGGEVVWGDDPYSDGLVWLPKIHVLGGGDVSIPPYHKTYNTPEAAKAALEAYARRKRYI